MGRLGAFLSEARERLGIELHDAAQQTRISIHYLKALEDEEFSRLPGEVFVRGFLKNYARYLNLPESEVIELYSYARRESAAQVCPATQVLINREVCDTSAGKETPLEPFVWGAVIFIAIIAFMFTSIPKKQGNASASKQAEANVSAGLNGHGSYGRRDQDKLYLEITALEDAWVLVRTDSSPQKKAILKKGERVTWSADQRFLLSYANIGAVQLSLNGRDLIVNGPKNAAVRDLMVESSGIVSQNLHVEQPPQHRPSRPAQPVQAEPAAPSMPSLSEPEGQPQTAPAL